MFPSTVRGIGLALFATGVSCAGPAAPSASEDLGVSRSAILAGTPSDASQDFAVMLVFSDPATMTRDICTAALVAPRLVLTARHCVADTDADVACNAMGAPVRGGVVHAKHDARKLFVFTGRDRPVLDPATWKPAGQGIEVIDDGSPNLCNHDIALVLLEKPIDGVPLASLRLDGDAEKDEQLVTIGWGVTQDQNEPAHRQQRGGVSVTRVGPNDKDPALTPNEYTFDESICLGDSGGPILSQSYSGIVGVVSRGGNGMSSDTNLSLSCVKATNLGTKISPFRELLNGAFAKAQAQPVVEVRPASPPPNTGCTTARRTGPATPLTALSLLLVGLVARRAARQRSKSGPSTRAWNTK